MITHPFVILGKLESAAGLKGTFQLQDSLVATIEVIPSVHLKRLDADFAHVLSAPPAKGNEPFIPIQELVSGLLFVRVLEVAKPNLLPRAYSFKAQALALLEPIYRDGLELMRATGKEEKPKSGLSKDLGMKLVGEPMSAVAQALRLVGIVPDGAKNNNDYCVDAAVKLVKAIAERVGVRPSSYTEMDAYIAGMYAFGFTNFLTFTIGGDFEYAAPIAAISVVKIPIGILADPSESGRRAGEFASKLIDAFNNREASSTFQAIAQNLDALVRNPHGKAFERLVELFVEMRRQATQQAA